MHETNEDFLFWQWGTRLAMFSVQTFLPSIATHIIGWCPSQNQILLLTKYQLPFLEHCSPRNIIWCTQMPLHRATISAMKHSIVTFYLHLPFCHMSDAHHPDVHIIWSRQVECSTPHGGKSNHRKCLKHWYVLQHHIFGFRIWKFNQQNCHGSKMIEGIK